MISSHMGFISSLVLMSVLCGASAYIDIFKVDNIGHCNVKNGSKLFSDTIYIRHLNATEQQEEEEYQTALKAWHEASAEFSKQCKDNNGTAPENFTWPHVPDSRSFCFGYDVTQFNFSRCIILNNIAYAPRKEPKHLSEEQIKKMVEYAEKLEIYGIYLYDDIMQKRGKSIKSAVAPVRAPRKPTSICYEALRKTQ